MVATVIVTVHDWLNYCGALNPSCILKHMKCHCIGLTSEIHISLFYSWANVFESPEWFWCTGWGCEPLVQGIMVITFPLQVIGYGKGTCLNHGPWAVEGVTLVASERGFLVDQKWDTGRNFLSSSVSRCHGQIYHNYLESWLELSWPRGQAHMLRTLEGKMKGTWVADDKAVSHWINQDWSCPPLRHLVTWHNKLLKSMSWCNSIMLSHIKLLIVYHFCVFL